MDKEIEVISKSLDACENADVPLSPVNLVAYLDGNDFLPLEEQVERARRIQISEPLEPMIDRSTGLDNGETLYSYGAFRYHRLLGNDNLAVNFAKRYAEMQKNQKDRTGRYTTGLKFDTEESHLEFSYKAGHMLDMQKTLLKAELTQENLKAAGTIGELIGSMIQCGSKHNSDVDATQKRYETSRRK